LKSHSDYKQKLHFDNITRQTAWSGRMGCVVVILW